MSLKHSLPEIAARLIVTFFGLFMLALGIDLTLLADLGTDALTSPALAASTLLEPHYPFFTVGNTLICASTIGLIIGLFFHIFPYWDKLFAAVGHRSSAEKEDDFD